MPESARRCCRAVERGPQRRAPRRRLAGVMDLVEHDERRPREVVREQVRRGSDLLVGDHDAVDVFAPGAVGVAPARVKVQPDAVRGIRPLRAQRGRRADDHDLLARSRIAWQAASVLPAPGVATSRKSGRGAPRGARGNRPAIPAARSRRPRALDQIAAWAQRLPVGRCGRRRPRSPGRRDRRASPGRSGAPHDAQCPRAARNRATRVRRRKRRTAIRSKSRTTSRGTRVPLPGVMRSKVLTGP